MVFLGTIEIVFNNQMKGNEFMIVKRGDIYFADLSPVSGSEQGGVRPVVIVQNDIGNRFSPTTIVAAVTAQIQKAKLPTHVEISAGTYGFDRDSVILLIIYELITLLMGLFFCQF